MANAVRATVFYSWQSDTPGARNRNLILRALEDATKEIASDDSINVVPVVDRDTQNVAGAPDISGTILGKIRAADVIVADVTIINSGTKGARLTPNPNVLIEVGYALAIHSESRLVLINNLAFGRPEDLPFDIRPKRILNYRSAEETTARSAERRDLQSALKDAVSAILTQHNIASRGEYPVQLSMTYRVESQSSDVHEYVLNVDLTNSGVKIINQWHVDIEMPTPLLKKASSHVGFISQRSNKEVSLIRFTAENHNGPIFPGDTRRLLIAYRMNHELYEGRGNLLEQSVRVHAYIQDTAVAGIEKPVGELQNF